MRTIRKFLRAPVPQQPCRRCGKKVTPGFAFAQHDAMHNRQQAKLLAEAKALKENVASEPNKREEKSA